ncbi:hypothetical protein BJY04DRAFT_214782 [Aspergillus karnatakaensis]|uniref:uncharacterized protein n=1 Tax=Aspergillus karnatakaensis TaxID=1810916 RepID=UPI003CCD943F
MLDFDMMPYALAFIQLDTKACTTEENQCSICRQYMDYIRKNSNLEISDLLYKRGNYPVTFLHKTDRLMNMEDTKPMVQALKSSPSRYFKQEIKVSGLVLPYKLRLEDGELKQCSHSNSPGWTILYMVDFPQIANPRRLIGLGLLDAVGVPRDAWVFQMPAPGKCLSSFRLEFFSKVVRKLIPEEHARQLLATKSEAFQELYNTFVQLMKQ